MVRAMMRRRIQLALTAAVGAGWSAAAGGAVAVEPALEPDKALLAKIEALPGNTWLKVGPVKTAGDLSWCGKPSWPNTRNIPRFGPDGRDYCVRMAWAPERRRALFCGGNHRMPHYVNDVWECDLPSNTWVCLYAPDPQYPVLGSYPYGPRASYPREKEEQVVAWVKRNVVYEDGVVKTKRAGPARPSHTWYGLCYDSERRRMYFLDPHQGLIFTDEVTMAKALGVEPLETSYWRKEKKRPGAYIWSFDPAARKWDGVQTGVPRCAAPAMEFVPGLQALWLRSGSDAYLCDRKGERWTWQPLAKGQAGYGTVSAYDPHSKTIVVVDAKKTSTFSLAAREWKLVQPDPPIGGRDATCFFYYDPVARLFVLYTRVKPGGLWLYDLEANRWIDPKPKGDVPPPGRGHMTGYYDPARNVTVYYNGREVWLYRCKREGKAITNPPAKGSG